MDDRKFEATLQSLLQQGFIYEGKYGYTILQCPTSVLIKEIEEKMKKITS